MLKAIVLPGAVASAVAQRPPILPVLSHWYVLNMLQKLWQNQGLITTPNNFISTRIKTKINQYLLKPDSYHCFAATIRQEWPWNFGFSSVCKKKYGLIYYWVPILNLKSYSRPNHHGSGGGPKGHAHPHDPVRLCSGLWIFGLDSYDYACVSTIGMSVILLHRTGWQTVIWKLCEWVMTLLVTYFSFLHLGEKFNVWYKWFDETFLYLFQWISALTSQNNLGLFSEIKLL